MDFFKIWFDPYWAHCCHHIQPLFLKIYYTSWLSPRGGCTPTTQKRMQMRCILLTRFEKKTYDMYSLILKFKEFFKFILLKRIKWGLIINPWIRWCKLYTLYFWGDMQGCSRIVFLFHMFVLWLLSICNLVPWNQQIQHGLRYLMRQLTGESTWAYACLVPNMPTFLSSFESLYLFTFIPLQIYKIIEMPPQSWYLCAVLH